MHADVVVISSAVKKDNPEVVAARARKIPVIPRRDARELMRLKYAVAMAGSHGKTTTTSMVATVLAAAGLDPTSVVGGKVNVLGSNAKLGKSELMVVEADESDGSSCTCTRPSRWSPTSTPSTWTTTAAWTRSSSAFVSFCNRVPFYGLNVLCVDHPNVQALPHIEKRYVTYGSSHMADYRLENVQPDGYSTRFRAWRRERTWRVPCAWWARTTRSTRSRSSRWPRRWRSRSTPCARRWPSSAACSGASP